MGSLEQIMGMIPGINKLKQLQNAPKPDAKQLARTEAIIKSMTMKERNNHRIIDASRRQRIAKGSGTTVAEVNQVLKSFAMMLKMMRQMKEKGILAGAKHRKVPKGLRR